MRKGIIQNFQFYENEKLFKNGHFSRACMEKIMDHQYEENGARNIH